MKLKDIKTSTNDKAKMWGQFFTKEIIIEKLLDTLLEYKTYAKNIRILEPSFGTGNFIKVLKRRSFYNIDGCEIDNELTSEPKDFFEFSLKEKYDVIIGNPPFTKYNIKESYFLIKPRIKTPYILTEYLPRKMWGQEKEKTENVFILKAIKHLKNNDSSIAFILPVSFFIRNRNKAVKDLLLNTFSTIVIYQNKEVWFDYNIPCCFAIFTNSRWFNGKIILHYENDKKHREIININRLYEEIIPEVFYNKKTNLINNHSEGILLKNYLSLEKIKYMQSYNSNNISGKNISERKFIPHEENAEDYKLAIVRVGNSSIGKCGLINIKKDTLNGMFYVFDFDKQYTGNKQIKEAICEQINKNQAYFRNITCRVGSKSIKKEDIFNFRVTG